MDTDGGDLLGDLLWGATILFAWIVLLTSVLGSLDRVPGRSSLSPYRPTAPPFLEPVGNLVPRLQAEDRVLLLAWDNAHIRDCSLYPDLEHPDPSIASKPNLVAIVLRPFRCHPTLNPPP